MRPPLLVRFNPQRSAWSRLQGGEGCTRLEELRRYVHSSTFQGAGMHVRYACMFVKRGKHISLTLKDGIDVLRARQECDHYKRPVKLATHSPRGRLNLLYIITLQCKLQTQSFNRSLHSCHHHKIKSLTNSIVASCTRLFILIDSSYSLALSREDTASSLSRRTTKQ